MCVYYVYVHIYIYGIYKISKARLLCLNFIFQKKKLIQMKTKEDRFVLAPSLPVIKCRKDEECQGFPLPS